MIYIYTVKSVRKLPYNIYNIFGGLSYKKNNKRLIKKISKGGKKCQNIIKSKKVY